ncbi:MAG: c-type cytochrome [Bryobacterales bacterium]|nr:c-type cytochrome [Bryobacterales bacterium]
MPSRSLRFALAAILLLAAGCANGRRSPSGFRLPSGDTERGKLAFVKNDCQTCHEVSGTDLPKPTAKPPVPVLLGGDIDIYKTDGYLVTSIINPSHQIVRGPKELLTVGFESRMPSRASDMTVQELADIVEFLQAHYVARRPLMNSGYY